jgi:hypothetical protein
MEAHLVGDEINAISSYHVEGGVCYVYDAGNAKDKGKPDGEKGEYTPTDETAHDDVQNEIHIPLFRRKQPPRQGEKVRTTKPVWCKVKGLWLMI